MSEIVAVDIGGTHARFALAVTKDGKVSHLDEAVTLRTADHASFEEAWAKFGRMSGEALPNAAAIALAGPTSGETLKLTNCDWVLHPAKFAATLGIERHILINDFGAVGHAVAQAGAEHFVHLTGPDHSLPDRGTISIIGPGTGLGVSHVWRDGSDYRVQSTEGGHLDFAPLDAIDEALVSRLRKRVGRVSTERIASGPGLAEIYAVLAEIEGRAIETRDNKALWQAGLDGTDRLATAAVSRFCATLGSVAGDIALAQGGSAVVMAGGLGLRLKDKLANSGFAQRFCAKGRFQPLMESLPVKLITHPQPGLFGAAAAFAREYARP